MTVAARPSGCLDELVQQLESPSFAQRCYAKTLLIRIGADPAVLLALCHALLRRTSPSAKRSSAAYVMGHVGRPAAGCVPALTWALRQDECWSVRDAAAVALGRIGSKAALEALEEARARDQAAVVRTSACISIEQIEGRLDATPRRPMEVADG